MNTTLDSATTVSFDARPAIARGEEPLSDILEVAATLQDGDILDVIAPFDPQPLYPVLRARGFRTPVAAAERSPGEWSTCFTRVAIAPTQTVAAVQSRHPATAPVFAQFGLDACCGGGHTLAVAAGAHGVDLAHLLTTLQTAAIVADPAKVATQGNP